MKGVLILNAYDSSNNNVAKALKMSKALKEVGVETETVKNDVFLTRLTGKDVTTTVEKANFALYFDKDKYTAAMLEKAGVRVFNSARSTELCDDKMETHIALANQGIPMPETLAGALCYTDAAVSEEYLSAAAKFLGLPMVVKECYGSYGKQVYLARDFFELKSIVERIKNKAYLFQRYVEESRGRDIRVLVIGGKVIAAMERRAPEGDFRSNCELGGKTSEIFLPETFKLVAEKAAKILELDYCGIDLLYGKDDSPLLCEVNSNAMFNALERTTGVDIAAVYAKYIVAEMTKKNRVSNAM